MIGDCCESFGSRRKLLCTCKSRSCDSPAGFDVRLREHHGIATSRQPSFHPGRLNLLFTVLGHLSDAGAACSVARPLFAFYHLHLAMH